VYWEDVGFLKASYNRLAIFLELSKGEKTPGELRDSLQMHFSQISLILGELVDRELVVCKNLGSRKGKIYGLTEKGKSIIDTIGKVS
jgi:predicted transcriptional regulator